MKSITKQGIAVLAMMLMFVVVEGKAQQVSGDQILISTSKTELNQFEKPKNNSDDFDRIKLQIGGDFALQLQGINHSNPANSLSDLGENVNHPTANLNFDVQLYQGMSMHMRTYLSSRQRTSAYVKGAYLQIDQLDFIEEGYLSEVMEVLTIKIGMDEINYGDAHFRRSDNAAAINNPFVGNYLMDSYTVEPFIELIIQNNEMVGVLGGSNGRMNQSVHQNDGGLVLYGKLGYDTQVNTDLRLRLTGSFYTSSNRGKTDYLYMGDQAGSRYYNVITNDNLSGRFIPGFSKSPTGGYLSAFQLNHFVKYQQLEFFGLLEVANNRAEAGGSFNHFGAELIYRLGRDENLYLGTRLNSVTGEETEDAESIKISRINIGAGWFLTDNVLAKLEYVQQNYTDEGFISSVYEGAQFQGIVIEAVISF